MQHQIIKEVGMLLAVGIPVATVGFLFIYANIVTAAQCQQMIQGKSYIQELSINGKPILIDNYTFQDIKIANITILAACTFTNKTTGEGYAFG